MSTEASEHTEIDADLERRLRDVVDKRPTCEMEINAARCFAPAQGMRVALPCGEGIYSCRQCHAIWVDRYAMNMMRGPVQIKCPGGKHEADSVEWRDL